MSKSTKQSVLFEDSFGKPVHVAFDAEGQTSDAGVLLLAAADRKLRLTSALASHLVDTRSKGMVVHSLADVLRQRTFAIAAGYEDGNDAAKLRSDSALLLACRGSSTGTALASQSSISRFENSVSAEAAVHMGRELEDIAVAQLRRRRKKGRRRQRIIIDLDPSVDPAHGAQQGVLFHGFYGRWCYLPMFGFLSFEGSPSQLLFSARLRPGTSRESHGTIPLLRRIVAKIRESFGPRQGIVVRLDGGFLYPRILDELERLNVRYVVGMGTNKRLQAVSSKMLPALREQAKDTGEAARSFDESQYRARSWSHERRVITKAEVIPYPGRPTKENPRHVVTNLRGRPESIYELYCMRGDAENRIKELKCDLQVDRTSCSRFVANQVRVLMTAAAFVLYQEIRWRVRTRLAQAQVGRLRDVLVKVGARIVESTRRVVLRMPQHFAFQEDWIAAARALGARFG
ncbi:MAG: IS1380 family transposase [Planctomycetota bacterium]